MTEASRAASSWLVTPPPGVWIRVIGQSLGPRTGAGLGARGGCYPPVTMRLVEIRLLEGPNVYRLEPVVKVEVGIGRRRTWYGDRVPARYALVRLRATVPERDWPDGVEAIAGWARRLRREHREGIGRIRVHRSSDPGHWILTWPWAGAERARLIAEAAVALADRGVTPARRARLTGSQERLLATWRDRIDRASATPPPWIRDSERRMPVISISGTNGKSTTTRLLTRILLRVGHHVGTTTSDGILVDERMVDAGRLDGSRRRPRDPAPQRRRRRRPRDRARRPRPARHRLRVERCQHPHQRQRGPSRPPGHPHAAGAGRGQGHDLPDHEARRLGDPQRATTPSSARSPARSGRRSPCSPSRAMPRRRSDATSAAGGRAYLVRDGLLGEANGPDPRGGRRVATDRLRARDPHHPLRPGAAQRRQRPGRGGRGPGPRGHASTRSGTGSWTSARSARNRRAA